MSKPCKKTGKVKYRDEIGAKIALASTQRSKKSNREELRVYLCPFCNSWHLTKRPARQY